MSSDHPIGDWLARRADRLKDVLGLSESNAAADTARVAPSQVTGLHAVILYPRSIILAWTPPTHGTLPFGYTVFIRPHGSRWWAVGATSLRPRAEVFHLVPDTAYDVEVMTHNF